MFRQDMTYSANTLVRHADHDGTSVNMKVL